MGLEHLEAVEPDAADEAVPFRMPVQCVNRPNEDFRGYAGRIAAGIVRPGDRVRALPSGRGSAVARIVTADHDLPEARAGQSVTLTLTDEIDLSRGDVLTLDGQRPALVADELFARVLWVDTEPAVAGRSYQMKLGTAGVPVRLDPPRARLNIGTGTMMPAVDEVMPALNEVALLPVRLDRAVVFDRYATDRELGGFILVDRTTNMTVAMGMVEQEGIPKSVEPGGLRAWLMRVRERSWRSLTKAVTWRATGSVDTFILTWIISGNPRIAASVGGFEVFTKIFLYYLHERVWARIPFGLRPNRAAYFGDRLG